MMSFLQACSLSPTRVIHSCGVKVVPQNSDVIKMAEAGVSTEWIEQIVNNQDVHDLCMKGI